MRWFVLSWAAVRENYELRVYSRLFGYTWEILRFGVGIVDKGESKTVSLAKATAEKALAKITKENSVNASLD